ncbi:hypothetical protein HPP92_008563 [Vanilla planifolia]|uniref:Beta-galactosidase n=1 Tax=Vanilla planifolia TaxID=51239 RepID=A0A835R927_VANPL|nr:hypothetical protein HPP92_008563 [Vanilla planifolia]
MDAKKMAACVLLLVAFSLLSSSFVTSTQVSYNGRAIVINGQRRVLFSGSIHYPRSTPEMWPELIRKAKEGGLDAIETYVFWNAHEPQRRQYNFDGNLDIVRFIKEIQNAGLYAVVRIGPYVCAEWDYGGLPAWLRHVPGLQMRTNNQPFENEMKTFTTLIVDMFKNERLLAPQGGPIILTQIENEYGNIQDPYGDDGKLYIKWCALFAESLNVGVPWVMCQQSDAPSPMINTCNGFYCNDFAPNNVGSPKMWTENWTGWFKAWDKPDPHRLAQDLAFAVARFFQSSGTFQNYYMYHGGTNFGRSSGGPYVTTTYDYDAPLDEYGNIRQPKWGHLKELHLSIKKMENALTYGSAKTTELGNGLSATKFSGTGVVPGCLLANKNTTADATMEFEGTKYFLPAWSISVLPDCKQEVYNTAKVNVQTSIMVKKQNQAEDESKGLVWSWRRENLTAPLLGLDADFTVNKLNEQVLSTADASSEYAQNGQYAFVFEKEVNFQAGRNNISLLSATVGLQNYGAFYELMPTGIAGGPVQLIGNKNDNIDLSSNNWSYKIGLIGEKQQVYLDNSTSAWKSTGMLPTKLPFTWYKTTFQAPLGSDTVVVDLLGMGKGAAWVNGQNIGRFWPNYNASQDGCHPCDYRGTFQSDSCQTGCGEPAQRWYHVPRSFLKSGEPNTLVLFEEAGGDPNQVNFQTVTVGTMCANVTEGKTLTLSCEGSHSIDDVEFASFGDPEGECGSFEVGSCDADGVLALVKQEIDRNLLSQIRVPWSTQQELVLIRNTEGRKLSLVYLQSNGRQAFLLLPFEDRLCVRLQSLLPFPESSPTIPLSWLTHAVQLLSSILADAAEHFSDHSLSPSDRSAIVAYLDPTIRLLDACNSISSAAERHLSDLLRLRLAISHLSLCDVLPPLSERVHRARRLLSEWENRGAGEEVSGLIPPPSPRGTLSAVQSVIYAVEAVSCLVIAAVASVFGGVGSGALQEIPSEVEAIEWRVRKLSAFIDGAKDGEDAARMRSALLGVERAEEKLTADLENLSKALDGMFRSAMHIRSAALQILRVDQQNV